MASGELNSNTACAGGCRQAGPGDAAVPLAVASVRLDRGLMTNTPSELTVRDAPALAAMYSKAFAGVTWFRETLMLL